MSITGEPGGPPVKTGNPVADINAGHPRRRRDPRPPTRTGRRPAAGRSSTRRSLEAALQQTFWHAAIVLRDRRIARPDRLGARADRAVPGVPRERRLDQHRRREPGELGAHRRRARPSGMARRSALRDQLGANGEPRRAGGDDERGARDADEGRVDRPPSMPPACPPGRSTRSAKRSRIRRRSRAAWSSTSFIRRPGATKALGCPVHFSATPTRDRPARAAAGRAYARGAARIRLCGRGNRRLRRRGRRRGGGVAASRSNVKLAAQDLERISAQTLEHYAQRAEAFREGTRDHDVSQNIDALLRAHRGRAAVHDSRSRLRPGPRPRDVYAPRPHRDRPGRRCAFRRDGPRRTAAAKSGSRIF